MAEEHKEGQPSEYRIIEMTPAQYLELAFEDDMGIKFDKCEEQFSQSSVSWWIKQMEESKPVEIPELHATPSRNGNTWKITGHDGRHRVFAASLLGITKIKVFVKFYTGPNIPKIPDTYDRSTLIPNYKEK